jgi:hypothetical protein
MSSDLGKAGFRIELEGIQKAQSDLNSFVGKLNQTGTAGKDALAKIETAQSDYRTSLGKTDQALQKSTFSTKNFALGLTAIGSSAVNVVTSLNDIDKAALRVRTTQKQVEEATQKLARTQQDASSSAQDLADAQRDLSIATERNRLAQDALNDKIINTATNITSTLVTSIFVAQNAFKGLGASSLVARTGLITTGVSAVGSAGAIGSLVPATAAASMGMRGLAAATWSALAPLLPILLPIIAAFAVWESNLGNLRGAAEKFAGTNLSVIGGINSMTESLFSGKSAADMAKNSNELLAESFDPMMTGSLGTAGSSLAGFGETVESVGIKTITVADQIKKTFSDLVTISSEFKVATDAMIEGSKFGGFSFQLDVNAGKIVDELDKVKKALKDGTLSLRDFELQSDKLKEPIKEVAQIYKGEGKHAVLKFLEAVEDTGVFGKQAMAALKKEVLETGKSFDTARDKAKKFGDAAEEAKKKQAELNEKIKETNLRYIQLSQETAKQARLLRDQLKTGMKFTQSNAGDLDNLKWLLNEFGKAISEGDEIGSGILQDLISKNISGRNISGTPDLLPFVESSEALSNLDSIFAAIRVTGNLTDSRLLHGNLPQIGGFGQQEAMSMPSLVTRTLKIAQDKKKASIDAANKAFKAAGQKSLSKNQTKHRRGGHSRFRMDRFGGRVASYWAFTFPKFLAGLTEEEQNEVMTAIDKERRAWYGGKNVPMSFMEAQFERQKQVGIAKAAEIRERKRIAMLKAQRDEAISTLTAAAFQQSFGLIKSNVSTQFEGMNAEMLDFFLSSEQGRQDLNNMLVFKNMPMLDLTVNSNWANMDLNAFSPDVKKRLQELIAVLNSPEIKALGT